MLDAKMAGEYWMLQIDCLYDDLKSYMGLSLDC